MEVAQDDWTAHVASVGFAASGPTVTVHTLAERGGAFEYLYNSLENVRNVKRRSLKVSEERGSRFLIPLRNCSADPLSNSRSSITMSTQRIRLPPSYHSAYGQGSTLSCTTTHLRKTRALYSYHSYHNFSLRTRSAPVGSQLLIVQLERQSLPAAHPWPVPLLVSQFWRRRPLRSSWIAGHCVRYFQGYTYSFAENLSLLSRTLCHSYLVEYPATYIVECISPVQSSPVRPVSSLSN